MQFDAQVSNPQPAGTIFTSGNMGPWAVDDPGETPVAGGYRFEDADLGVFKGIAGILNSTGKYEGVLRNLEVDGQTRHRGFQADALRHGHAAGDNLPCNSGRDEWGHLAASGARHTGAVTLYRRRRDRRHPAGNAAQWNHSAGRAQIALNVNIDRQRMEDFLRLTSKSRRRYSLGS